MQVYVVQGNTVLYNCPTNESASAYSYRYYYAPDAVVVVANDTKDAIRKAKEGKRENEQD